MSKEYKHSNPHEWVLALIGERIRTHRHEYRLVENKEGKTRFKIKGRIGKYTRYYVIVDGEKHPMKYLTRLLIAPDYDFKDWERLEKFESPFTFHQVLAKELWEMLGFETGAFQK